MREPTSANTKRAKQARLPLPYLEGARSSEAAGSERPALVAPDGALGGGAVTGRFVIANTAEQPVDMWSAGATMVSRDRGSPSRWRPGFGGRVPADDGDAVRAGDGPAGVGRRVAEAAG
jgi:hypothetical protein